MTPEAKIEQAFHVARLERLAGRSPIAVLQEAAAVAIEQLPDSPLGARAVWKLAKALADQDGALDLDALEAAHSRGVPVFEGPHRLRAVRALRWHQDHAGYGRAALASVWDRLWRAAPNDAHIALDAAWCHLCRGDLEQMHEVLDGVEDTEGVLYTTLCASNWSGEPEHVDAGDVSRRAGSSAPPHLALALLEHQIRYDVGLSVPHLDHPYADAMRSRAGFLAALDVFTGPEFRLAVWQSAAVVGEHFERPPLLGCTIFDPDDRP